MCDFQLIMMGVTLVASLVTLVLTIFRRRMENPAKKTVTGTRTYCGHCGSAVPNDPLRVVVLTDRSYFVYGCKVCKAETLLPTQLFP